MIEIRVKVAVLSLTAAAPQVNPRPEFEGYTLALAGGYLCATVKPYLATGPPL